MLMMFNRMKRIGKMRKNKQVTNFCLAVKSWMFEIKVVSGIKRVFMRSIEISCTMPPLTANCPVIRPGVNKKP